MRKRTKIAVVLRHMFSKKALGYRAFTVTWTMIAVAFWTWKLEGEMVLSESLEITMTIVIGKFLFYGIWEFFHLKEVDLEAVYDVESHERVDEVIAARDSEGKYHDPDVNNDLPPGTS